jgi:hypothetical protein
MTNIARNTKSLTPTVLQAGNAQMATLMRDLYQPPPELKMSIKISQYSRAGSGWKHDENLVKSMITGRKRA